MRLLRIAASASPESAEIFSPARMYSPPVGLSRQPIRFMNVDLPEPDGPMTATNSFFCMDTVTPRSAATICSPTRYSFTRSVVRISASVMLHGAGMASGIAHARK